MKLEIYAAGRDLSGFFVGVHQFIIIETNNTIPVRMDGMLYHPKILGNGVKGYVLGAHNVGNLLQVKFFEEGDYTAAKEYFGGKTEDLLSDYDTELKEIQYGYDLQDAAIKIFMLTSAFILNQKVDSIKYPFLGRGYNSNSWVNSIVRHTNGLYDPNFYGADISHDKVIPLTYLSPNCPAVARRKLNQ